MRGKTLSERTMSHAKLDMLIDYYLGEMERQASASRGAMGPHLGGCDHPIHADGGAKREAGLRVET